MSFSASKKESTLANARCLNYKFENDFLFGDVMHNLASFSYCFAIAVQTLVLLFEMLYCNLYQTRYFVSLPSATSQLSR